MTCIIGATDGARTIVGADSVAQDGYMLHTCPPQLAKIWRDGPLIIGMSGALRIGQVVQAHLRVEKYPHPRGDFAGYLTTHFVPALRSCLREHGCLRTENGMERMEIFETATDLLVAAPGHVALVLSCLDIMEPAIGYAAIGGGREVACGAVHALRAFRSGMSLEAQAELALAAAAELCPGVRAPFVTLETV